MHKLLESNKILKQIVENASEGIWILNNKANVVYINDSGAKMIGFKVEDVTGNTFYSFIHDSEKICKKFKSLQKGRTRHLEIEFKNYKDEKVYSEISLSKLNAGKDDNPFIFIYVNNLTEQKKILNEHQKIETELISSREKLRQLAIYQQKFQEDEKMKIAREIHDELGQSLSAFKIGLSLIEHELLSGDYYTSYPAIHSEIIELKDISDYMIFNLRNIITKLRPQILDNLGLIEALEWQLEEFQKKNKINCNFYSDIEEINLDKEYCTNVFRIFQEALNNILKHSRAKDINVNINYSNNDFVLSIIDDGIGFSEKSLKKKDSFGIMGMKERAKLVNGNLEIQSIPGKGTTLKLSFRTDK